MTFDERYKKTFVYGIIILLSFILYGTSIFNDYALDDTVVIRENKFTKKGVAGIRDIFSYDVFVGSKGRPAVTAGGRYRPLSLATFAIEYECFGPNPHISHFINIVLYSITGILIYIVLSKLFINFQTNVWPFSIPFWATILFMVHPLHSEVVANIKGRDEIMSLLLSLLTLFYILEYIDLRKSRYIIYGFVAFFLAFLSKESSITFVAVIPLSIYFFKKNSRHYIPQVLFKSLLPATILFLILRHVILGRLQIEAGEIILNNPFLNASSFSKYATIFYTLGLYLKLLFYPHPLTYDYYPYHIPIISWWDLRAIIPFVIYCTLAIYSVLSIRKQNIVSYSILFYLISLSIVSNLFFPIGAFMAERFIYTPSLGFCVLAGYAIHQASSKIMGNKHAFALISILILIVILSLSSSETILRCRAWKDNYTLFTTDVHVSSNSAIGNFNAGSQFLNKALEMKEGEERNELIKKAIQYMEKSIGIYPQYTKCLNRLADAHYALNGNYELSKDYLEKSLELDPDQFKANMNLGTIYLNHTTDYDKAIYYLKKAVTDDPNAGAAYANLGIAYFHKGNMSESINMLEKAVELEPSDADSLKLLGIIKKTGK